MPIVSGTAYHSDGTTVYPNVEIVFKKLTYTRTVSSDAAGKYNASLTSAGTYTVTIAGNPAKESPLNVPVGGLVNQKITSSV